MGLLKKRFPQAQLAPYASEGDMINAIIRWRRNLTDILEPLFGSFIDDNTDLILRFDTCVNGFGKFQSVKRVVFEL